MFAAPSAARAQSGEDFDRGPYAHVSVGAGYRHHIQAHHADRNIGGADIEVSGAFAWRFAPWLALGATAVF